MKAIAAMTHDKEISYIAVSRKGREAIPEESFPAERRQFSRFESPVNVIIENGITEIYDCDLLVDVSTEGIKIETDRDMKIGESITFYIPLFEADDILSARGSIVWKLRRNHVYEYGIHLEKPCPMTKGIMHTFQELN